MSKRVIKPIFIIGAARSGTTMLSHHILAHHPDVAFWSEPAHIWRYGHAYRSSDRLTPSDVTPEIRSFIIEQFTDFLENSGKARFMEKTPSNCFRLPFILEIFPDAKFVHILRDGRDAASSASSRWKGDTTRVKTGNDHVNGSKPISLPGRVNAAIKRIRDLSAFHRVGKGHLSLGELPAYLPNLGRTFMRTLSPGRTQVWGPRFPGIKDVHRTYSLPETCAIQWDCSVRAALGFGRGLAPDQYLEIKYEDVLSAPEDYLRTILAFLELDDHVLVYEQTRQIIRQGNSKKWTTAYSEEELNNVMVHIGPTLRYLGYNN